MEPFVYDEKYPHLGGNIDGGDSFTSCPLVWGWFINHLAIETVLDVGCGQGHALRYFANIGCSVLGIEGLPSNAAKSELPVIVNDIQATTLQVHGIDLVWCCELVEHIEEQYLCNLLPLLTCGKYLAMTHAEPKQVGHHHVNCQPQEYWIEKITACGFNFDEATTELTRGLKPKCNHYGWHGLFFRRIGC
jgi:SAM-dependent methyltransferase